MQNIQEALAPGNSRIRVLHASLPSVPIQR
jgi:hypothetical protein